MSRWHTLPERGSELGLRTLLFLLRWIGYWPVYVCLHFPVMMDFLTNARGRRASVCYLTRIGRLSPTSSRWAVAREVYSHFHSFSVNVLDRFALWSGDESFEVELDGHELIMSLQGRGGVLVGAHIGSFDFMRIMAKKYSVPVNVVMYTGASQMVIKALGRINASFFVHVHDASDGLQTVFSLQDAIQRGELVSIMADRHPPKAGRKGGVQVPFLGTACDFPAQSWIVANSLKCPVLYVSALRVGYKKYRLRAVMLSECLALSRSRRSEELGELVARYAELMEEDCRRSPLQWFNFLDFWHDEDR